MSEATRSRRPRLIGALAVMAAVVAGAIMWPTERVPPTPVARTDAVSAVSAQPAGTNFAQPASTLSLAPVSVPTFDVVRVTPSGGAVLAGRAAPGSDVSVAANDREIGHAQADRLGAWVLVPAAPLAAGGQELTLSARLPDGSVTRGDTPVVVALAPPQAAASRGAALVMAVPRDAAPILLQPPRSAEPPLATPGPMLSSRGPASTAAPSKGRFGLDVVDYDDHGAIRFAGAAQPGAAIRLYVDDAARADGHADLLGRWTLTPEGAVAAGDHRVRVDQLGAGGRVLARVELPFQRVAMTVADMGGARVIVQPRQNLWRIARRVYGQGMQYTVIYEANREQIRDPALIYPGQIIATPGARETGTDQSSPHSSSRSR